VRDKCDPLCLDFTGDGLNDIVIDGQGDTPDDRGEIYVYSGAELAEELAARAAAP
jgi:hypothetical protein